MIANQDFDKTRHATVVSLGGALGGRFDDWRYPQGKARCFAFWLHGRHAV
jgi:hypothetical protein